MVPAIGVFYEMQGLSVDGTDDAFVRSVGLMLFISPFIFIFVAVLTFYVAVLLDELKQLKPWGIAVTVATVSSGLAFPMAFDRLSPFGWRDALYYYFGFSGLIFATLGLSAIVWWMVARPNRMVERNGSQGRDPTP